MNACCRKQAAGFLLATCLVLPAAAGSLANFEASANSGGGGNGDCIGDPLLWDLGAELAFYGLAYGGMGSWTRMDSLAADDLDFPGLEPREWGEGLIPAARADGDYQWLEGDIHAARFDLEAGFGPFAGRYARTRFEDDRYDEELTLTRFHALYRMSFGGGVEVDLGLGRLILEGEGRDERFSYTVPVRLHLLPGCGVEFRPEWSENISEYSLGLLAGWKFVSLTAGYRWLHSPDETLDGPYAGLSLHF